MNAIEMRNVSKRFGQTTILNDLNLIVPEGSIFGLIGENGAGKTTTMKILLGLLPVDSGSIQLLNHDVKFGKQSTNQSVGYLPDVPQFYDYMSAFEYLLFCGTLTKVEKKELKSKVNDILQQVGLKNTPQKIGSFSRGMKQRLGLAQALLNDPKLIICDEPTSALDPTGRHEFLELLNSLKGKATILFSSHILSDVEQLCDHVAILHNGKIHLTGTVKELTKTNTQRYFIEFSVEEECNCFIQLIKQAGISLTTVANTSVTLTLNGEVSEHFILEILCKEAIFPLKLQKIEPSLEDIFLEVISHDS